MNTEEAIEQFIQDGKARCLDDCCFEVVYHCHKLVKPRTVARALQRMDSVESIYDKQGKCYYRIKSRVPDWLRPIYFFIKNINKDKND